VVVEPIESQVQRKWWTASFHAAPGRESLAPGAFSLLFELFACVFPRIPSHFWLPDAQKPLIYPP
jgi:hypothetical protein